MGAGSNIKNPPGILIGRQLVPLLHLHPKHWPALIFLPDDRDAIRAGDKTLLIIEDDRKFAKIVYDCSHTHDF